MEYANKMMKTDNRPTADSTGSSPSGMESEEIPSYIPLRLHQAWIELQKLKDKYKHENEDHS